MKPVLCRYVFASGCSKTTQPNDAHATATRRHPSSCAFIPRHHLRLHAHQAVVSETRHHNISIHNPNKTVVPSPHVTPKTLLSIQHPIISNDWVKPSNSLPNYKLAPGFPVPLPLKLSTADKSTVILSPNSPKPSISDSDDIDGISKHRLSPITPTLKHNNTQ